MAGSPPPFDPLAPEERSAAMRAARPRVALPAFSGRRRSLPLLPEAPTQGAFRPRHAVWELTLRCDQACRHCGSRAGAARPDELSTDECLDLVRQLAELGVMEVTMIGGEAYLRPDFLEIVRAVRAHGMQPTLTTGGRGLDEPLARALREAGVAAIGVSIDGDEAVHDRLRGRSGAHRAAVAAIRAARRAGMPVSVNSQINRLSLPDLPAILELLVREGARAWQVMLTVAMGRAVDEPELLLQPYDLLALFPMLDALVARATQAGVRFYPGNNLGYFGPYEARLRGTMPRGHAGSCSAGRTTLGIEADGVVKGCPSLTTHDWAAGNVRDASLRAIWERGASLRYTRERTVDALWGHCRECYYAEECRGGCTWTASALLGRPGNNPYCHHRALELERLGLRERIVRTEPAPGEPFDRGRFDLSVEPLPTAHTKERP